LGFYPRKEIKMPGMNLEEFQKLPLTKQQEYFEKRRAEPEIEEISEQSSCSEATRELIEKVKEDIRDEYKGARRYQAISKEFSENLRSPAKAELYHLLAENENLHAIILEGILDELKESCG
jgi:bacterioferritin (cytochrome b1)